MNFYSVSGHSDGSNEFAGMSAQEVLKREDLNPNSTIDARRIIGTIRRILQTPQRERFLDIGCGYGFFSLEAQRSGFSCVALELASHERSIARVIANIDADAVSFEEFQATDGTFSAILMSQILEHAQDINLWLSKANALLRIGGVLAIAVPNFDGIFRLLMGKNEPYICPPAHLNFFGLRSLRMVLEKHCFQVMETQCLSRIPTSSIEKRLPSFSIFYSNLLAKIANNILRPIDTLGRGQMICLYGRKVANTKCL